MNNLIRNVVAAIVGLVAIIFFLLVGAAAWPLVIVLAAMFMIDYWLFNIFGHRKPTKFERQHRHSKRD